MACGLRAVTRAYRPARYDYRHRRQNRHHIRRALYERGGPLTALFLCYFDARQEFTRRLCAGNASPTGLDLGDDRRAAYSEMVLMRRFITRFQMPGAAAVVAFG